MVMIKKRTKEQVAIEKAKGAPLCACGCGQKTNWDKWACYYSKYLNGHHSKGKKCPKISKLKMGHKVSEETRLKISIAHKGKKLSKEHKMKISLGGIERFKNPSERAKISVAGKGKKQTKEHLAKRIAAILGVSHYRWNPKFTNADRLDRRLYPEYKKWRALVFQKDEYTCQSCGDDSGGNLVAHHLESYNNAKELRTQVSNGVTLCIDCHLSFHHNYGRGDNTKQQFIGFIENNQLKEENDG